MQGFFERGLDNRLESAIDKSKRRNIQYFRAGSDTASAADTLVGVEFDEWMTRIDLELAVVAHKAILVDAVFCAIVLERTAQRNITAALGTATGFLNSLVMSVAGLYFDKRMYMLGSFKLVHVMAFTSFDFRDVLCGHFVEVIPTAFKTITERFGDSGFDVLIYRTCGHTAGCDSIDGVSRSLAKRPWVP